jgi:hypothetical protein
VASVRGQRDERDLGDVSTVPRVLPHLGLVPPFQVNKIVAEENCEFRPQQICHSVRKKRNRRVRRNHWQKEQQQQRQKRSPGRRNRLFKYFDEQPQQQQSSHYLK